MASQRDDIGHIALLPAFVGAAFSSAGLLGLSARPGSAVSVPSDFLGVNIAPAEDPEVCAYSLARLADLGLRQVRLDFTYASAAGPAERYLEEVLEAGFDVLLNVFPPREEARVLHQDEAAQRRFSEFVHSVFQRYQHRVAIFEIGNTPNRGKWSGFSSRSFIAAWTLAAAQAREFDICLAGPNVSDFEPLFNGAYLSLMQGTGAPAEIHTDNLFVERVVEPEARDHRVLGRLLTNLVSLNLIKKARLLAALGESRGSDQLFCSYVCWTTKRLSRRSATPHRKAADYLQRYLVLAAASGSLQRIYWGPLICNRDGLIDDQASDYPEVDQVSHYEKVRGQTADFTVTPAFYALRQMANCLPGATCRPLLHQFDGLSVFVLEREGQSPCVITWCRDAMTWPLSPVFSPHQLLDASFTDSDGKLIPRPMVITEHPLFIQFSDSADLTPLDLKAVNAAANPDVVHLSNGQYQSVSRASGNWRGACMLRTNFQAKDAAAAVSLEPERVAEYEELRVMRDVRNRLWNVADPRGLCEQVTVKLNRVKGIKHLTYRFKPSKGKRHWNNACRMWRSGVATPLPVAYYEQASKPGIRDSWYLCEFIPDAFSCREVYAAFRDGAQEFQGLNKASWFDLLSRFICNMHNKQIVHRDLSAGNLLLQRTADNVIQPQVIDIGRAWIWAGPGSRVKPRHRLQDLMRICYKLDWADRHQFIACYESHFGAKLGRHWRLPFHYYDLKQSLKKTIKGKRSKRSGKPQ